MSDNLKMGLLGSKQLETSDNNDTSSKKCVSADDGGDSVGVGIDGGDDDDNNKCESHKYAFYNPDNDSETYNTESLSIMDINDIIGVKTSDTDVNKQTNQDVSLEIDNKLLKEVNKNLICNSDDMDDDNGAAANSNNQLSNISQDKSINEISLNVNNLGNNLANCPTDVKDNSETTLVVKEPSELCKSLQLIGEAYLSDDSQEFDTDNDLTEPKVVFSCKLVADKISSSTDEHNPVNLDDEHQVNDIESIVENVESQKETIHETLKDNLLPTIDNSTSKDCPNANEDTTEVQKEEESILEKEIAMETETTELNGVVETQEAVDETTDILKSSETIDEEVEEKCEEIELKLEEKDEEKMEVVEEVDTKSTEALEMEEVKESEPSIEPDKGTEKLADVDLSTPEVLNVPTIEKLDDPIESSPAIESPPKDQDEPLPDVKINEVDEILENELLHVEDDKNDSEIVNNEIPMNLINSESVIDEVKPVETLNVNDTNDIVLEENAMDIEMDGLEDGIVGELAKSGKTNDDEEQMQVDEPIDDVQSKADEPPASKEIEKEEENIVSKEIDESADILMEVNSTEIETVVAKVDEPSEENLDVDFEKDESKEITEPEDATPVLETFDVDKEEENEGKEPEKVEEVKEEEKKEEEDEKQEENEEKAEEHEEKTVEKELENCVEENETKVDENQEKVEENKEKTVEKELENCVKENEGNDEKAKEDEDSDKESISVEKLLEKVDEKEEEIEDSSILETVEEVSNLKSDLIDSATVDNELMSSTGDFQMESDEQMKSLDDKLPSPPEKLIEQVLESSLTPQNIDSLEGLLDFIPIIDETKIKEDLIDEKMVDKSEEKPLVEEEIESTLLSNEIQPIAETINFLDEVIETIDEETTKPFDCDNDKLIKDNLLINSNNLEPTEAEVEDEELDIPFNIDQNNILKLSDDTLNFESSIETLQQNSEISELESAVKFLQESEDQNLDSLPNKINKLDENVVVADDDNNDHGNDNIYSQSNDISTDLNSELDTIIASESISISEAEIINEAAKLENEKKQINEKKIEEEEEVKVSPNLINQPDSEIKNIEIDNENDKTETTITISNQMNEDEMKMPPMKTSIIFPKTSILEERLREPPKIEIPMVDNRLCEGPISSGDQNQMTPKTNLLIPRDSRMFNYQKMLESPKMIDKHQEGKIIETSRKDADKQDHIENVGSPRIILKIAKSAIADCSEPRSPKSPKIRSTANSPNPEDSPGQKLGKIKLKLSKGGHPSIISNDSNDELGVLQWHTGGSSSLSPLGMKFKISKSGDASIVQSDKFDTSSISSIDEKRERIDSPLGMKIKLPKSNENMNECKQSLDSPKRTDSPLGMKIKLSKSGDASIISSDESVQKEIATSSSPPPPQDLIQRTDSPLGVKIKLSKTGDASIVPTELEDSKVKQVQQQRTDSPVGMKIKLSKKGIASIVSSDIQNDKLDISEVSKRTESPIGMKIKLSKTGDASIIHSELYDDQQEMSKLLSPNTFDSSDFTQKKFESKGMKIKLSRDCDGGATIIHSDDEQNNFNSKVDSPIGLKIKLSNTGDASIIQSENDKAKLAKMNHEIVIENDNENENEEKPGDLERTRSETIEESGSEGLSKRKESPLSSFSDSSKSSISLSAYSISSSSSLSPSPVETKKMKLSQVLPEMSMMSKVSAKIEKNNSISRQQMNVINQEISITQVNISRERSNDNLKSIISSPSNDDCQIIESHPEVIIVNEDSCQDVMIIDEVSKTPEIKVPKKRGRPRRILPPQDPLAIDDQQQHHHHHHHQQMLQQPKQKKSSLMMDPNDNHERPKRMCRSQKSYAPPKRGRGRGRGKRKYDRVDQPIGKRTRLDHDLSPIDQCHTDLITIDDDSPPTIRHNSSEIYKVLRQPLKSGKVELTNSDNKIFIDGQLIDTQSQLLSVSPTTSTSSVAVISPITPTVSHKMLPSRIDNSKLNQVKTLSEKLKGNELVDHQNWLTPMSKKQIDINVIDEETRMSAEPTSRSQTPARNISNNGNESIINEESQGSVVSTATTESEKVKVKSRRMEINFDPDEGPFTVDKIAEYEWPPDRKNETFMIQEQISQYLGVKSFKRKYPDLKRRIVDMEERNFLRENCLVSEAMCDMGLTAIYSSEVLDIMCSDFPDQYEEYRKHMRERQIKEHSKKQKELSAATNAEKNRIDLAEMAVQSALNWNVTFNKSRKETRRCSLDLQTFTIHVPKKQLKLQHNNKVNHYPVALIPGQYTDYYREYTPAELRYYPLNTVLYGPMRPNERNLDSQSEGSQSDSDSDSSSDDSSCSSSEATQDTEESQSMDDVDIELSNHKDKSLKCKICLKNLNKTSKLEILIQCGTCGGHVHPSCIDLTLDMVPHIQAYAWQCTDCKTCAQCHDPADEDKMLFCDMCDRGYHIYCVGLRRVPQGRWHCLECAFCGSCGAREAGGINAERNTVAQWQHEYKKGDKNTRVYVSTLCVPCSKLWRKGRYCPHCSRCHTIPRLDLDENLVHCSACDKYLHIECVENKHLITDKKNYQCDVCVQNRNVRCPKY